MEYDRCDTYGRQYPPEFYEQHRRQKMMSENQHEQEMMHMKMTQQEADGPLDKDDLSIKKDLSMSGKGKNLREVLLGKSDLKEKKHEEKH